MELYGEDAQIARWIEPAAADTDPADCCVLPRRVPVWAIIGQLKLEYWKAEVVAGEYELPLEAVQAAMAYYRRNQRDVDQRVAANRSFFRV
jgi:uncharacterized protein (DUF433 family)